MEQDEGVGDDEPIRPLLPPDDRVWRHPSEVGAQPAPGGVAGSSRPSSALGQWSVALLGGVVGAVLAVALLGVTGAIGERTETVRTVVEREMAPPPVPVTPFDAVAIVERVKPSIVEVHGAKGRSGAGVVFRSDGHVLTNEHLVSGTDTVRVVLHDGTEESARVIGSDADTDIAVLKVEHNVPPAVLGTSGLLKVGQTAIAVGASLAVGVVSALGKELRVGEERLLLDMIQLDVPAHAASTGGALIDGAGGVVGIVTTLGGAAFATPIDIARSVAYQVLAGGKVVHAWLGIDGADLDAAAARALDLDGGTLVRSVWPKSPAAAAGLESRDVIIEVDGVHVASMAALKVVLRSRRPGQTVTLTVLRDSARRTFSVTLADRPAKG